MPWVSAETGVIVTRSCDKEQLLRAALGGSVASGSSLWRNIVARQAPLLTWPELSPREAQTLQCLLRGMSEKQAAIALEISPHTVHVYAKKVYRLFNVSSRGELFCVIISFLASSQSPL